MEGRKQIMKDSRQGGLKNLPKLFDGTNKKLTCHDYVTQWKRFCCTDIDEKGYPVLEEDKNGKIWQAENADREIATNEFWRVMHDLQNQLKK